MSHSPIDCQDLCKSFGRQKALQGLNLKLQPGEILGVLGPNGAGKSTTIRILLGLMKPTAGKARVFGLDPWVHARQLHRRMAYVPGDVTVWPNLSGGQIIDFLGKLHGGLDPKLRADLIDRFQFDPTRKGRQYSKGNRQKVAIIAALARSTDLLILDEPTNGLDPLMEQEFQAVIKERRDQGTSVLLSSHILSEVQSLADRVSIIKAGRIVRTGSMAELQATAHSTLTARLAVPPPSAIAGLNNMRIDGHTLTASVDHSRMTEVLSTLTHLGVDSLTVTPPTLEDLFLDFYADDKESGQ